MLTGPGILPGPNHFIILFILLSGFIWLLTTSRLHISINLPNNPHAMNDKEQQLSKLEGPDNNSFAGPHVSKNRSVSCPSSDKSELEFGNAIDYLPQGIRIINMDYTVRYVNSSFAQLLDITVQEAVGKKCYEVFPNTFCHTPGCRLARICKGEKMAQAEIDRKNKDGSTRSCMVSAFPLYTPDNKLIGIMESFRDITDKKELESKIREAEERYKAIVDLTGEVGEGILMLQDIDGREGVITFASQQCCRMTGYTNQELLDRIAFDLLSPDGREASLDRHRRKMQGEVLPGLYEVTIVRKDGSELPMELTSAITQFKGKPANVVYLRDISSRKVLEAELKNEKNKYQTFFEEAPVALWELDYTELKHYVDELRSRGVKDFREYFDSNLEAFIRAVRLSKLVRFNKAHYDLWEMEGYETAEDYSVKSVKYFYKDSDNFKALKDDFVRLAHGATTFDKEETVQTLKGNRRYIYTRFTIAPGCEETWARVFTSLTDITERKKAEIKLQHSEKRWHTLFQSAPVAMWELDYSDVRHHFDKLARSGVGDFRSYFDRHPEEVKYCVDLPNTVSDVNYAAYNLFEAAGFLDFAGAIKSFGGDADVYYGKQKELLVSLAEGSTEITFETSVLTAKANRKTVLMHFAVPPEQEHTLARVFVSAVDITAMKEAEAALKAYQANLEDMVSERTKQLNQEINQRVVAENNYKELYEKESSLRREIEILSENKLRYTRSLVHELRTPLTSLIAANDFLVGHLSGQYKEFALAAQRSILKLEHRVNELLDMSKGEVGLLELDCAQVDMSSLLRETYSEIEAMVSKNGQLLLMDIAENLPHVRADADRIHQVVFNLVDNAVKFNPRGGTINIKANNAPGSIIVRVQDEGPGIEEANMPLLFEPYKGVKQTAHSMGGLGLGLPLSKMLVELHGGKIWVESQLGTGSTFCFSLPVK